MARSVRKHEDGRLPWARFSWSDWENDPALALCSMAAQGFWMRLLCLMAKEGGYLVVAGKSPTPDRLAYITRQEVEDVVRWLAELEEEGVFSRANWRGTAGVIYSRRMVRELKISAQNRENGKRGGNPSLCNSDENSDPLKADKIQRQKQSQSHADDQVLDAEDDHETGHEPDGGKTDGRKQDGRKPDAQKGEVPADLQRIEETGKRAWATALRFLELRKVANGQARAFVGKLVRDHGLTDEELLEVGVATWRTQPHDVRPFMVATARAVVERRRENDVDPEVERAWLREFVERPASWRGERGPRPGSAGCKVRPAILREFGFEPVLALVGGAS